MNAERVQKTQGQSWFRNHPLLSVRGLPEVVASSGISSRLWRLYAETWLICLLFPILFLIQTSLTPLRLFIALAGLAIFVIIYTWFMWPHPLTHKVHLQLRFPVALMALAGLIGL